MTTELAFVDLLEEVRQGSQQAAWTLIEEYGPHVRRVVRRSLSNVLRSRFDSADFAQVVWLSFFSDRAKNNQFTEPGQLIGFLAEVARNKVITEFRRQILTCKRDMRRERAGAGGDAIPLQEVPARQATPSEFAMAHERWDKIMSSQPECYQEIVRLRISGETHESIADRLRITERTVRRVIKRIFEETFDGAGR